MITLGLSQRETDRVLEALGLGKKPAGRTDHDAGAGDGGGPENPRRIFRKAFYVAIGGLITAGIGWAGHEAGKAVLTAGRAEISLHRTVATHSLQLEDHEQRLQQTEAQARALVKLPPDATAQLAKLIALLEADAKARSARGTR